MCLRITGLQKVSGNQLWQPVCAGTAIAVQRWYFSKRFNNVFYDIRRQRGEVLARGDVPRLSAKQG